MGVSLFGVISDHPSKPDFKTLHSLSTISWHTQFPPADQIYCFHAHYHLNTRNLDFHDLMEVLGVIAAVASIAEVGRAAAKLVITLHKVAKDAGNVGERLKRISWLFTSFEKSIRVAQKSIEYRCPQDTDSPVILYIEEHGILESLKDLSDNITQEIMDMREAIKSLPSRFRFITSWKWTRMKPEIMDLHPQMESMKTTFTLVLEVITLEQTVAKNKERPSEEYEKEIEFLKMSIEEHVKTIRDLRREHQLISVSVHTLSASTTSLASQLDDQLRAVCHLGQSFVETEAVPTRPPEEFSFSDVRRRQSHRRRHVVPTSRPAVRRVSGGPRAQPTSIPGPGSMPVPVPVPVPGPSSLSKLDGSTSPDTVNEEGPSAINVQFIPENDGEGRPEPTSRRSDGLEESEASRADKNSEIPPEDFAESTEIPTVDKPTNDEPETRNLHADEQREIDRYTRKKQKQTETSSTIPHLPEPTPPQTPTSPTQTSRLSTTPSHSYHHPEQSSRRVPSGGGDISRSPKAGYIVNKTGRHLFQAHVDRQLLGNLITPEYAKELGLSIRHHPRQTINYRGTEIESIGRVFLDWSTRSTNTLVEPASIECTVCEPLEYPLLFGGWFIKAERYMSREEDREVQD